MSKIIVIGGHGHVARLLTPILVSRGDTVTSIIRNPDQAAELESLGAKPVVADVEKLTIDCFGDVIQGHDAVVWSAGAGGGNPSRTWAIDRDAAIYSMQAAKIQGVSRYVMVSYSGSYINHGVDEHNDFFTYAQSKAIADAVLRNSGLDYTIVGPGALTHEPGTGLVSPADAHGSVPREDVAAFVAAVLHDPTSIGQTYRFTSGDTAIADFVKSGGTH